MTKLADIKWDKDRLSKKRHVSDEDKQAMADYYQAGLKTGKSSEDLLAELEERYGKSSRQIQRYIAQITAKRKDPANSLTIRIGEAGGTAVDPESGKGGQLVVFTLGNCSQNVLTVERICLEVLSCQSYDELPHIEARLIPFKYEVKLSPNRLGDYVVTEEKFRYAGPDADDFDLVCSSPQGFKYNVRLNIYYSDLATKKHFTLSSDSFDFYFYKEGSPLSRYIHKEHARRLSQRD